MKIVHYITGVPPMREGGMVRYAMDLAEVQQGRENDVSFLVPGGRTFASSSSISKSGNYKQIPVYSISNPPLIPMGDGIRNPEDILNRKEVLSDQEMSSFFLSPFTDVLHIHTFLGLPDEIVAFCNSHRIRLILSTHDYFPICPRLNLIDDSGAICRGHEGLKCGYCNRKAPSAMQYKIRSSTWALKCRKWLNPFRKVKKVLSTPQDIEQKDFTRLIRYYRQLFERMDGVHFNSTQTAHIYRQVIRSKYNKIIPISHLGLPSPIDDTSHPNGVLRFGFIGDLSYLKGYPLLVDVLNIFAARTSLPWELQVYGKMAPTDRMKGRVVYKGAFSTADLGSVLGSMDLLIVPSQCKETFCFVVQEALAAGTPVLASWHVGARDLIESVDPSYLFDDRESLLNKLLSIAEKPYKLSQYREKIRQTRFYFDFHHHVSQMDDFYKEVSQMENRGQIRSTQ